MPRKASDDKLDTRTARLRLKEQHQPYWRNIQAGRAVGYRRAKAGEAGQWQARFLDRDGSGARVRKFLSVGTADDILDADGVTTLNFAQAQEKARAWFTEVMRQQSGVVEPITVAEAMTAYVTAYKARGGKALAALESTVNAHILPRLGDKKAEELTHAILRKWHHGLATAPARVRTKKKATKQAVREVADDDTDGKRARRATANRILTVLKAALNLAYADGRVASDDAWRRVKPFKNADAAKVRFLTDAEATRLVNAADASFRPMIIAALLTGARWGELVRFQAMDFNLEAGTLHVRVSKTNKARHIMLTEEGREFFKQQCAGKTGKALILPGPDGEEWGKSAQQRPMREACEAGKIAPAIGFHILRHTYASRAVMAGVPLGVVAAQIGDSEVTTAKHYAHLSPGHVAESIRAAFTPLGIVPASNVTPLTGMQ